MNFNCKKVGTDPFMIIRLVFIFIIVATPFGMLAQNENAIKAVGIYDYTLYQQDGAKIYSSKYNFEVLVKGCLWIVKYEQVPQSSTSNEAIDVGSVASCDGTNIYVFHLQNQETAKIVWGDRYDIEKIKLPVALANIYLGTYPPPKEPVLQHIWLAIASSCCVFNNSSGKAKVPFITDMEIFGDDNYDCDYHWTTSHEEQSIRELVLTTDGKLYVRDPTTGDILKDTYPKPYDKGFTNGIGRWLEATNINGVSIPVKFNFKLFTPKVDNSGLINAYEYQCVVSSVSSVKLPQIPFQLPDGKVLVSDRRFLNRGHAVVNYATTTNWVNAGYLQAHLDTMPQMSLKDEVLNEMGIKPLMQTEKTADVAAPKTRVIRFLLGICVALPIAMLLIHFRSKNKTK
jgi:hypothetical protein